MITTPSADAVQLVVEDEGQGMSAEVQAKAFDPFFTTKAKGTGLGLSICRKIIHAQGGTILLESTAGKGTKISVTFAPKPG